MTFKVERKKLKENDYGVAREDVMKIKSKNSSKSSILSSPSKSENVFRINDKMEIVARYGKTRKGFKHTARLFVNGREVDKSTAHYLNRTWESYEYKTAVDNLIDKTSYIPQNDKQKLKDIYSGKAHEETQRQFGTIGRVASLGEVFGKTKHEKNVWKLRMIRAGLGKSFQLPDDWDKLSEDEKGKRLDAVIKHLKK